MGNEPFTALEGSTVMFAIWTIAPIRFDCSAYRSVFVGSVVETVTTLDFRLMEKTGTGTELAGGEMAVSEEMLGF